MKAYPLACLLAVATPFIAPALGQDDDDDALDLDALFEEEFEKEAAFHINDPLERLNRAIFRFNDMAYTKAVKPFARAYTKVVPPPVQKGIGNVFTNLKFPSRFVSNVMQGRFPQAGRETGKFIVNSTVGIGGLFRASDDFEGLRTTNEDIAQAFSRWGIGHGFYVVLPLIGPTSLRDFVGDFADGAFEPLPEPWSLVDDSSARTALRAVDAINDLPGIMALYDSMRRSAIDPYSSVRDAYAQQRARMADE